MATHAALHGEKPVLIFSLEMSHLELTQRLLCAEARVDSSRVRNGRLQEDDWPKISHAVGRLGEASIFIDDNPHLTVMEIRAKARRLKSRLGELGLIVVDYLQLMGGRPDAESRQVEVSEISRGLKILARELETPVVALSQLSRNLENRADKRPMLADLRESGSLEQDADVVLFIYRDELYNPESADRGIAEINVAKHRNGPTGKVQLVFREQYTQFANMAKGV
jgi:replicative DNA helicase